MGGQRETTVKSTSKALSSITAGKVRIHESKGEVHLHDDEAGLKVAGPVHVWHREFARLCGQPTNSIVLWDVSRKTAAQVAIDTELDATKGALVTGTSVSVMPIRFDPTFEELLKFTEG